MDLERDRQIREIAYDLWEKAGRPAEGADQFWYQAERQLQEQSGGTPELSEDPMPYASEEQPSDIPSRESGPQPSDQPASAKPRRRSSR